MYGWIVDGISSLFEPIRGQNTPEWPGKGNRPIPTRGVTTEEAQQASRPAKRNYQSIYVADHVCQGQTEQMEVKRRRRDVVISFVKKTVTGVAGLLGLRKPPSKCKKCRPFEQTQIQTVQLMGIDELQTSWMSSSEWRMDKPAGGLNEREWGGKNAFKSSSPPLMRKFSGVGLPTGIPERGKDRRSSLQLLPSRPALGVGMGTSATNPDLTCPGFGNNRSYKPSLTVEEALKQSSKEHYRRLLEMVTEKYSKNQPLPFNRTKPQDASLSQCEHRAAGMGRTCEAVSRKAGPIKAAPTVFTWRDPSAFPWRDPSAFTWRDPSATKQTRDRRGDMCFSKTKSEGLEDTQNARCVTKQSAEVDLSTEVATRLKLVDREHPSLTHTDTHSTHTTHTRRSVEDVPRMTKEMAIEVSHALSQSDPNLVLSSAFKLRFTQRDLATLQEGSWLNDEVMNFYLSLVMQRSCGQAGGLKIYSFSTFFFPKLRGGGGGQTGGHASVKRWTKAVDLFVHDIILVPLHLGVHWAMAVIDFRSRSVRSYDSMGQRHDDICSILLLYLRDEHRAKQGRDLDSSKWTVGSLRANEIPQQKNGSDCGVFACKYADYISREKPLTFKQCHMSLFRRLMMWEILNQTLL